MWQGTLIDTNWLLIYFTILWAIYLENISNLITLPSSYECRKARLVHFVMHGRHTSMECMCEYWESPKVHFQNKWKQKLSYRIIRIKRIFPEFIDMYRYGLSSMLLFALWFLHTTLCLVRIYLQLFVAGRPSSLRYLCLLPLSDVQSILCCVFVSLVWCTICCQFLLIVPLFLIISSLRFIEKDCETNNPNSLNTMIKLGYGCLYLRVLYISFNNN
jgi:hypothetical protein